MRLFLVNSYQVWIPEHSQYYCLYFVQDTTVELTCFLFCGLVPRKSEDGQTNKPMVIGCGNVLELGACISKCHTYTVDLSLGFHLCFLVTTSTHSHDGAK